MFAQMELSRVIVSELNDQQAIYLREVGGTRTFPILIGQFEVQIINRRLLEEPPFRPMTHQLMKNIIETLGGKIEEVVITEMKDHTYYAILKIRVGDMVHNIDCRPSDAIAMAVHHQPTLPIFVGTSTFRSCVGLASCPIWLFHWLSDVSPRLSL